MSYLAFVSDFHPLAVHFPIALLPLAALLLLYQWRYPSKALRDLTAKLLWLAFAACLVAVLLGLGNRYFNGHSGEGVDAHATIGIVTTVMVLATALQFSFPRHTAAVARRVGRGAIQLLRLTWVVVRFIARVLWAVIRFLLIPVRIPVWIIARLLRRYTPGVGNAVGARFARLRRSVGNTMNRIRQRVVAVAAIDMTGFWRGASLAACLVLVMLTGLRGANLSHGDMHLIRNMPPTLKTWLKFDAENTATQLDQAFFEEEVLPVFRRSCVKCHGEHKQKKGLRLDSYAAVVNSGTVQFQHPHASELLRRMLLPRDDVAAMPPLERGRPLHSGDVTSVIHWLQGHSRASLAQENGGLSQDLAALARKLPPIDDDTLALLNQREGLSVRRLINNVDLLLVNLSHVPASDLDDAMALLTPLSAHVFHLDVSGQQLNANGWNTIAGFNNLSRLNLASSNVEDATLAQLGRLPRLAWLNLYATTIDATEDQIRAMLPALATLYLPAAEIDS